MVCLVALMMIVWVPSLVRTYLTRLADEELQTGIVKVFTDYKVKLRIAYLQWAGDNSVIGLFILTLWVIRFPVIVWIRLPNRWVSMLP